MLSPAAAEKRRLAIAEWQKAHPERRRAAVKRYRLKHLDVVKAKTKAWRDKNPERLLLWAAKKRAKSRGLAFTLELKDIHIPTVCPVFGIPLQPLRSGKKHKAPGSPSLDRFDSSLGYTPDNVWIISWRANNLKSNATLDELRQLVCALEAKASK